MSAAALIFFLFVYLQQQWTAQADNFVLSPLLAQSLTGERIRYECDFPISVSMDGVQIEDDFSMEFVYYRLMETAVLLGNVDSTPVMPMEGTAGITFLELFINGSGSIDNNRNLRERRS